MNSFFNSKNFEEAIKQVKFRLEALSARENTKFDQTWFSKHFVMGEQHISSDFETLLGESHITVAATTINRNSGEPMRVTEGLSGLGQKMFTHGHGYTLEADDLRELYIMEKVGDNKAAVDFIVNKLWNNIEKLITGVYGRLDLIILEALFNDGKFTFTDKNDPGSAFIGKTLEFGFNTANAGVVGAGNEWTEANIANVDPYNEIMSVVQNAGRSFSSILMDHATLMYILRCPKMKAYINTVQTVNAPLTAPMLNSFLLANGLPQIEIVDRHVGVQKDRKIMKYDPMKRALEGEAAYGKRCGKIVFLPDTVLGSIETQYTDAQIGLKSEGVDYSYYKRIEVARFEEGEKENSAYRQITKARLTAAPSFTSMLDIYTLDTTK